MWQDICENSSVIRATKWLELADLSPATLNNVAVFLHGRGRLEDAEELYRRAIEIAGTTGMEHSHLASIFENLSKLYRGQKRFFEAEWTDSQASAIKRKQRWRNHPDAA